MLRAKAVEKKMTTILFVDDDRPILNAFKRLVRSEGWQVHCAESGEEGLDYLRENRVDIVVSDMRMPNMNGAVFLTEVKNTYPESERILITGYSDFESLEKAVNDAKIANYVSKPWDDDVLLNILRSVISCQESKVELLRQEQQESIKNKKLGKIALGLKSRVEERELEIQQAMSLVDYTQDKLYTRSNEVMRCVTKLLEVSGKGEKFGKFIVDLSVDLGNKLGFTKKELDDIRIAATLHNIGGLALGDQWGSKPVGELDHDELQRYQARVTVAAELMNSMDELAPVGNIISSHKEHLDGSGYPNQRRGDEISLGARILGVVTDYVLLHQGRLLSDTKGHKKAKAYIEANVETHYDSIVVHSFFGLVGENTLLQYSTVLSFDQKKLESGMTLSEDLITDKNVLLLKAGTVLNENHINQIGLYERMTQRKIMVKIAAL